MLYCSSLMALSESEAQKGEVTSQNKNKMSFSDPKVSIKIGKRQLTDFSPAQCYVILKNERL